MVAFGRTKYLMASQKAETNSVSNRALAVPAKRFTTRLLSCSLLPKFERSRYDHDHGERQWQEDLPPEPHQLVVAVTGDHGLDHGDQEEQEADLPDKPYHTWNPGEGRHRKERQPAAEEQDRAKAAHQHDGNVFPQHEQHIGGRRIFDHET